MASAESLRRLQGNAPGPYGRQYQLKVLCILDKVEQGDHDGHGVLKYADAVDGVTPDEAKGVLRERIMSDLADAFGQLLSLDAAYSEP
jgi:hypothetical protein